MVMFPKKEKEKRKTKKHAASILQDKKECYITKKRTGISVCIGLHRHHIFMGNANRDISEANGFWVWLSDVFHTGSENGVHGRDGSSLDLELKQDCQRAYEEKIGSRESFIKLVGENYLD